MAAAEETISHFKFLSTKLRDAAYRNTFPTDEIHNAGKSLEGTFVKFKDEIERNDGDCADHLQLIQYTLQCLRNSCVECEKNQLVILNETNAMDVALSLLQRRSSKEDDSELLKSQKNSLQFIGNLISGNEKCQKELWSKIFPDVALSLMDNLDVSLRDLLCMIVFNCIRLRDDVFEQDQFYDLLVKIIDFSKNSTAEWALLVLEHIITSDKFATVYNHLQDQHDQRIVLFDLLEAYLDDETIDIPEDTLIAVSDVFKISVNLLQNSMKSQYDDLSKMLKHALHNSKRRCADYTIFLGIVCTQAKQTELMTTQLRALCTATKFHERYKKLRTDQDLLVIAVSLLKEISKEINDGKSKNKSSNGIFGVKRDLVRLIGNLCYGNKTNQDLIREVDGITAILNNCRIDDENPYISQWAVFAIRNLCEGNFENQKIISQFEKQGIAEDTTLLRDGINVELKDGKIRVSSGHPSGTED